MTNRVHPGVGTYKEFKAQQVESPVQSTAQKVAAKFASIRKFFTNLFTQETGREKHERAIQNAKNQEHSEMLSNKQATRKELDSQHAKVTQRHYEIARFGKELNPITRAFERFKDWQYARNLKTVHGGCTECTYTTVIKTGKLASIERH